MNDLAPPVCVDCRKVAPATESAYSLIGRRHAWRLTFAIDAQGKRTPEWRCAPCAERVKQAQRDSVGNR